MTEEVKRLKRLMAELEPLAYIYERFNVECFRVCAELYHDYKELVDHQMRNRA